MLLIVEKQCLLKHLEKGPKVLGWLYTMVLVLISWVIFASVDGQGGMGYFASMFGLRLGESADLGAVPFMNSTTLYLLRNYGLTLILCAIGSTPLPARTAAKIRAWLNGLADSRRNRAEAVAAENMISAGESAVTVNSTAWQLLWSVAAMAMFVVCTAYLVDATYNPFLYFRF